MKKEKTHHNNHTKIINSIRIVLNDIKKKRKRAKKAKKQLGRYANADNSVGAIVLSTNNATQSHLDPLLVRNALENYNQRIDKQNTIYDNLIEDHNKKINSLGMNLHINNLGLKQLYDAKEYDEDNQEYQPNYVSSKVENLDDIGLSYNSSFEVDNPLKPPFDYEGVENEPVSFPFTPPPTPLEEPEENLYDTYETTKIKEKEAEILKEKREKALEDLRQNYVGFGGLYSNVEHMKNKKDIEREITRQKKLQKEQLTSAASSSSKISDYFKPNPLAKYLIKPIQTEEPIPTSKKEPKLRYRLGKKPKQDD